MGLFAVVTLTYLVVREVVWDIRTKYLLPLHFFSAHVRSVKCEEGSGSVKLYETSALQILAVKPVRHRWLD